MPQNKGILWLFRNRCWKYPGVERIFCFVSFEKWFSVNNCGDWDSQTRMQSCLFRRKGSNGEEVRIQCNNRALIACSNQLISDVCSARKFATRNHLFELLGFENYRSLVSALDPTNKRVRIKNSWNFPLRTERGGDELDPPWWPKCKYMQAWFVVVDDRLEWMRSCTQRDRRRKAFCTVSIGLEECNGWR